MTPSYLLDTNVVSNLRKRRPHAGLIAWLATVPADSLFLAAVTISEIQCGIEQASAPEVAAGLRVWLNGMLMAGQPIVVGFDVESARILGAMWATPSLRNFVRTDPMARKFKSGADLAIAASAIAKHMTIVSRDAADFLQIHAAFPLPGLFDPFGGVWHVQPMATVATTRKLQ